MARSMIQRIGRLLHHRWRRDAHGSIPRAMLQRLAQRVARSEARHSGEIRISIEAGLPTSYVMRDASPRDRAVAMFGKLRVWDTQHNNGVLVYLLLAEHAIEIVADRGITSQVAAGDWDRIVALMREPLGAARYEDGLALAIDELTALLVRHFPVQGTDKNPNELPDQPVLG